MDDLVRTSGLSKGTLYWHFSSKEEVFLALFDRFVEEFFDVWSRLETEGRSSGPSSCYSRRPGSATRPCSARAASGWPP
jgi:AcrR family transcriptional regulator